MHGEGEALRGGGWNKTILQTPFGVATTETHPHFGIFFVPEKVVKFPTPFFILKWFIGEKPRFSRGHIGMNPADLGFGTGKIRGRVMKNNKMTRLQERLDMPKSSLDLWKWIGGETKRVRPEGNAPATDSLLAVYQDRFTYTFILDREVASIHYDRSKNEIFFKGRNIRNFEPGEEQKRALEGLKAILMRDERAKGLAAEYEATLYRILADNKAGGQK